MTTTGNAGAGWYPDPSDPRQLRWYDGSQWTQNVHATADPAAGARPTDLPQAAGQGYGELPADGCQVCGATPAVKIHLRGHQGMLLIMRFLTYRGQYCRDCGTSMFREVQSKTMLVGWWGYISLFVNTYNVIQNTFVDRRIRALGPPQGRLRAAKPPHATVFKSPGFVVTIALPLLLVVLVLAHLLAHL